MTWCWPSNASSTAKLARNKFSNSRFFQVSGGQIHQVERLVFNEKWVQKIYILRDDDPAFAHAALTNETVRNAAAGQQGRNVQGIVASFREPVGQE